MAPLLVLLKKILNSFQDPHTLVWNLGPVAIFHNSHEIESPMCMQASVMCKAKKVYAIGRKNPGPEPYQHAKGALTVKHNGLLYIYLLTLWLDFFWNAELCKKQIHSRLSEVAIFLLQFYHYDQFYSRLQHQTTQFFSLTQPFPNTVFLVWNG